MKGLILALYSLGTGCMTMGVFDFFGDVPITYGMIAGAVSVAASFLILVICSLVMGPN